MSQQDTLTMPSQAADSVMETDTVLVVLGKHGQQFFQKGYFAGSPYFHPEQGVSRNGVAGDPVPYRVGNDYAIAGLLLLCFVLGSLSLSASRGFMLRQAKNFFYVPRSIAEMTETAGEVRMQYLLMVQTALLLGIGLFVFGQKTLGSLFVYEPWQVVGVFFAVFLMYFLLKGLLYGIVDWVFFERKKNEQWWKTWLFLTAVEGVVLFPPLLLGIYFKLGLEVILLLSLSVIILTKLLSFYKCFVIFFKGKGLFLQIILYFCALELMPLMVLSGVLLTVSNYMSINY